MNARGLMELIVIKVGLDIGVIGHELFTMLLVMAIVTTLMTGPLLTLFAGKRTSSPRSRRRRRDRRAAKTTKRLTRNERGSDARRCPRSPAVRMS